MNLSDKGLKQIDEEYVSNLSREQLIDLNMKLVEDLRASRDRLNMTAENSSCPSGSLPPWWKAESAVDGEAGSEESDKPSKAEGIVDSFLIGRIIGLV